MSVNSTEWHFDELKEMARFQINLQCDKRNYLHLIFKSKMPLRKGECDLGLVRFANTLVVFRLCEPSVGNLLFIALEVPVLNSLFDFSYCSEAVR